MESTEESGFTYIRWKRTPKAWYKGRSVASDARGAVYFFYLEPPPAGQIGKNVAVVEALSASNGTEPLWTAKLDGREDDSAAAPAVSRDGSFVYVNIASGLYALRASDGSTEWVFNGGCRSSTPAVADSGDIFVVCDTIVFAVEPRGGKKLWDFRPRVFMALVPEVTVGQRGIVYVTGFNSVYGVNATSGEQVWTRSFRMGLSPITESPDGSVAFVSSENAIAALHPANGTSIWTVPFSPRTEVALSPDGSMIYVGTADFRLHALRTVDREVVWSFPTSGRLASAPVVDRRSGNLYFGSWDANFYAVDPLKGSKLWSLETASPIKTPPQLDADGVLFFVSLHDAVYALTTHAAVSFALARRLVRTAGPVLVEGLSSVVRTAGINWRCTVNFIGADSGVLREIPFSADDMACVDVPPPRDLGSSDVRLTLINGNTGLKALAATVSAVPDAHIDHISVETFAPGCGPDGRDRVSLEVSGRGLSRWPRCTVAGIRAMCASVREDAVGRPILLIDVTGMVSSEEKVLAWRDVCVTNNRGTAPLCGGGSGTVAIPAAMRVPSSRGVDAVSSPRGWPPRDNPLAAPWWWQTRTSLDPTQFWRREFRPFSRTIAFGPLGHLFMVGSGVTVVDPVDGTPVQSLFECDRKTSGVFCARAVAIDSKESVFSASGRNVTAYRLLDDHAATNTNTDADSDAETSSTSWSEAWAFTCEGQVGSPMLSHDESTLFSYCLGTVFALDAANGTTKWSLAMPGVVMNSFVLVGDTLYVSCQVPDHERQANRWDIVAVASNGSGIAWTARGAGMAVAASVTQHADLLAWDPLRFRGIAAIALADPTKPKWAYAVELPRVAIVPGIGSDGTVFVVDSVGTVHAVAGDDGSQRWTASTGLIPASSVVVDRDGRHVYVACKDQHLYMYRVADGTLAWSFNVGSQILTGPSIGPDGTIFVSTLNMFLVALRGGDAFSVKLDTELPVEVATSTTRFAAQPAVALVRDSSFANPPVESVSGFAIETTVVDCVGGACGAQPGSVSGGTLVSLSSNLITLSDLTLTGGHGGTYVIQVRATTISALPSRHVVRIAPCAEVKAGSVPSGDFLRCVCPDGTIDLSEIRRGAGCIAGPVALKLDVAPPAAHDISRSGVFAVQPRVSLRTATGAPFDASRLEDPSSGTAPGASPALMSARVVASGPVGRASLSGASGLPMSGTSTSFTEFALDAARGDAVVIEFTAKVALPGGATLSAGLAANATVNITTCGASFRGAVPDPASPRQGCRCGADFREQGGGALLECTACPLGSSTLGRIGETFCTCVGGFVPDPRERGACRECAPNAVRVGTSCACLPRYEGDGFSCDACPEGTNKTTTGDAACRCVPGWFRDADSVGRPCRRCPVDTFSETHEASSCTECPPGSWTDSLLGAATARMCECRTGRFLNLGVAPGGGDAPLRNGSVPDLRCSPCPTGADCAGGRAVPVAKEGWWAVDGRQHVFVECDGAFDSCLRDGCRDGYEGIMCQACAPGLGQFGNSCLRCARGRDTAAFAAAIVVLIAVLAFLVKTALAARATLAVVVLRSFLDYLQTMFFIGSFGFPFPDLFRGAVLIPSTGTTGGAAFLPLDCLFGWDAADVISIYSLCGICLAALLFASLLARGVFPSTRAVRVVCVTSVVAVVTLHPTIAVEALRAFRCRNVGGVYDVLDTDVRVDCSSAKLRDARALASAGLGLMSTGGIAVLFAVLALARWRSGGGGAKGDGGDRDSDGAADRWTALSNALAFLTAPYRHSRFWWGVVPLLRKSAIMALAPFARTHPAGMVFAAHVILVVSLAAGLLFRPYSLEWPTPEGMGSFCRRLHRILLRLGGPAGSDTMGLMANFVTLSIGPSFAEGVETGFARFTLSTILVAANAPMVVFLAVALTCHTIHGFKRGWAWMKKPRRGRTYLPGIKSEPLLLQEPAGDL